VLDSRISQHLVRFYNYSGPVYSYGRRLPGLQFRASLPKELTPPLNLPAPGRRQSLYVVLLTLQRPVFLVNSRLGHFSAASSCFSSVKKDTTLTRHPFSLSYGVNLPSSLKRVYTFALGFSPYLPVSVYGTVTCKTP